MTSKPWIASLSFLLSFVPALGGQVEARGQDFRLPRSFTSGGAVTASDYVGDYRVGNDHERLPTWKLYNLCRLVTAASDDCYKRYSQTFESAPDIPLLRLLQFNVPDLELAAGQRSEVYFLADAARVIRSRFGRGLQSLRQLRGTPAWGEIWMDHQPWHGIHFGGAIFDRFGSMAFDVVNLDHNAHKLSILLEGVNGNHALPAAGVACYGAATLALGVVSGGERITAKTPASISGVSREHFYFRVQDLTQTAPRYRLEMLVDGRRTIVSQSFAMNALRSRL